MNRRTRSPRRDEFRRLVEEARLQRAVYVSEAIAAATSAAWKAVARGVSTLRARWGPADTRRGSRRALAPR